MGDTGDTGADGRKHDAGKPQWGLLPWDAVGDIVEVLTLGARKYAPDNWRKVPNARARYFDAALRHLVAWKRGESFDHEWGCSHLAHAGCCVLFLLALDRVPRGERSPATGIPHPPAELGPVTTLAVGGAVPPPRVHSDGLGWTGDGEAR